MQRWCNLPYAGQETFFPLLKLMKEMPNTAPELPGWFLNDDGDVGGSAGRSGNAAETRGEQHRWDAMLMAAP